MNFKTKLVFPPNKFITHYLVPKSLSPFKYIICSGCSAIQTLVFYAKSAINYVFKIANPISAIGNLIAITLRNIIGDLDKTLTSRDLINTKTRGILDEATDKWGIKVNRVELKDIVPPKDIQISMEK